MNSLLKRLFNLGVKEGMPEYLSEKIIMSNQVTAILIVMVVIPFTTISLVYFYELAFIPLAGLGVCTLILVLNAFGITTLARLVIALFPITLASVYVAYLVGPDDPKVMEMYSISLSFVIIPVLVFDIREWLYLLGSALYSFVMMVFLLDPLNAWLDGDFDTTIVTEGYLGVVTVVLSLMTIFASISALAWQNYKSKKNSDDLVKTMDLRNEELKNSELKLKDNLEQIAINQQAEQKRSWHSEGLAMVGNLLRTDVSSQQLFDQLVSELTKYMGANQAALFVVNKEDDDDVFMELKSVYAYARKKFIEKKIKPGQGLTGQAWLEGDVIRLKEVPDSFIRITSGLGEATPGYVVIMPLIVNESVEGVLELAAFQDIEQYKVDFLKSACENIASFVSISRINDKTKFLLENSQQQAEEMRAQEEEMRQNMEELSATQEEMQRKEQEYISRIEELESQLQGQEA